MKISRNTQKKQDLKCFVETFLHFCRLTVKKLPFLTVEG